MSKIKKGPPRLPAERIWRLFKVDELTGCWVWQKGKDAYGYGQTCLNGKVAKAHRVAWEDVFGPIPKGISVCHRCDNPPCINPSHLFLATHLDNVKDMLSKNRHRAAKGEEHGNSKLSWNQVREIRELYSSGGITQTAIGQKYGLRPNTISEIISYKRWKIN